MTYLDIEKIGLLEGDKIIFKTLSGVQFNGVFISANPQYNDIVIGTPAGKYQLVWGMDWIKSIIINNKENG